MMNPHDMDKPDPQPKPQVENVAQTDPRKAKAIARNIEHNKRQPPALVGGVGERAVQDAFALAGSQKAKRVLKPLTDTDYTEMTTQTQEQAKKDPKRVAWRVIGWNDYTLDAASWWRITNIKPEEAALLLCQSNPNDLKNDPLNTTTTETEPADYKKLLREFRDVAQADQQAHTLKQWRDIAKARGLKYHSWIDEHEGAIQYLQKDADARRDAGRCSMIEAATELTTKSGAVKGYWMGLIKKQVEAGTLPLKNPKDYSDPLPYAIPQTIDISYDQVSVKDVNTWLAAHPELGNFRLSNVVPASAAPENESEFNKANDGQSVARPLQRQRFQEQQILQTITKLGYDPKAFPKNKAGKSGAKAEVRERLIPTARDDLSSVAPKSVGKFMSLSVFNKAWDRLRSQGEIQNAP